MMLPEFTPIDEIVAVIESDPDKKLMLDKAREWIKQKLKEPKMTPIDQLKQAINQKRAAGKTPVIYFNWDFYSSNKVAVSEVVNGYRVYTIIENDHPDFVVVG